MLKYVDMYQQFILPEDKKKRQVVSAGVTILWVILLLIFGLTPAVKGAFDAQNKILTAKTTLDALNTNLANLTKIEKTIADEAINLDKVLAAVPETPKAITAVNEIDLAVAVNSLVLEDLSYQSFDPKASQAQTAKNKTKLEPGAEELQKSSLRFEVQVRGTYAQINGFIKHLENVSRLIEIEQLNLRRMNEKELSKLVSQVEEAGSDEAVDTSGNLLRLNMDGIMYYQQPTETKN